MISIRAFLLAAYQALFLIFVSVFRPFASEPFPYFSYRPFLPSRLSFSCFLKHPLAAWFPVAITRGISLIHCNLAYFSKSVEYKKFASTGPSSSSSWLSGIGVGLL
jgi:hypothetical protein